MKTVLIINCKLQESNITNISICKKKLNAEKEAQTKKSMKISASFFQISNLKKNDSSV